ncbi:MAG: hypothetical protein ACI85I_001643, partial [Arenicella sp.]
PQLAVRNWPFAFNFGETKLKLSLEFNRIDFGAKSVQLAKPLPKIGNS